MTEQDVMNLDGQQPPQGQQPTAQQQPPAPIDPARLGEWIAEATAAIQQSSQAYNQLNVQNPPGHQSNPNVNLPTYSGKTHENINTFFYQLEQMFDSRHVPAEKYIQYTIGALKGGALIWCHNQSANDVTWNSFAEFKKAIIDAFELPNYQVLLRKKLAVMKQTKDVQTYIVEFRNILGQITEIAELDQVQYFQAGLKPATRTEVNYRNPQTIEQAIKIAIEFDAARFGVQRPLLTQNHTPRNF